MKSKKNIIIVMSILTSSIFITIGVSSIYSSFKVVHNKPIVIKNKPLIVKNKPLFTIQDLYNRLRKYRTNKGLKVPILTQSMNRGASKKCNDMAKLNYWSHNRPNGDSPWVFFDTGWIKAGENLARRLKSSQAVEKAWENSPKHNKNLLDPAWNRVGYAICTYPTTQQKIVVQHFEQVKKEGTR